MDEEHQKKHKNGKMIHDFIKAIHVCYRVKIKMFLIDSEKTNMFEAIFFASLTL